MHRRLNLWGMRVQWRQHGRLEQFLLQGGVRGISRGCSCEPDDLGDADMSRVAARRGPMARRLLIAWQRVADFLQDFRIKQSQVHLRLSHLALQASSVAPARHEVSQVHATEAMVPSRRLPGSATHIAPECLPRSFATTCHAPRRFAHVSWQPFASFLLLAQWWAWGATSQALFLGGCP